MQKEAVNHPAHSLWPWHKRRKPNFSPERLFAQTLHAYCTTHGLDALEREWVKPHIKATLDEIMSKKSPPHKAV